MRPLPSYTPRSRDCRGNLLVRRDSHSGYGQPGFVKKDPRSVKGLSFLRCGPQLGLKIPAEKKGFSAGRRCRLRRGRPKNPRPLRPVSRRRRTHDNRYADAEYAEGMSAADGALRLKLDRTKISARPRVKVIRRAGRRREFSPYRTHSLNSLKLLNS